MENAYDENGKAKFLKDLSQEHITTKVVYDKFFKLLDDRDKTQSEIVTNMTEQYEGKDIIRSADGIYTYYDLKCQTNGYINHPTPTFAFELSFINPSKKIVEGWFIKKGNKTHYYTLIWIHETYQKDSKVHGENDIKKMEIMNVSKRKLKELILNVISEEKIRKNMEKMRDEGIRRVDIRDDMWLIFSEKVKPEQPINIIVRKESLAKISDEHIVYDTGKIINLKTKIAA